MDGIDGVVSEVTEGAGELRADAPAVARPASTVLLVRDGSDGIEVYMQKRHAEMPFAASAHIFPGGSMDERDGSDDARRLVRGDLGAMAARMELDEGDDGLRRCAALVVCAVREVAEETGIALARRGDGGWVDAAALGERLRAGDDFVEAMAAAGLGIDVDDLTYVAHFITPVGLPRRYDTHFFVAAAPPGQAASVSEAEASADGWYTGAAALAAGRAGEVTLMRPTHILCSELCRHPDVAALRADLGARPVPTILFRLDRMLAENIPDHLPSVAEVAALGVGVAGDGG